MLGPSGRCWAGRQSSDCNQCVFHYCCWGPQRCFLIFSPGPHWCSSFLLVWGPQWCPPVCLLLIIFAGPPSRQASWLGGAPTKAMMFDVNGDGKITPNELRMVFNIGKVNSVVDVQETAEVLMEVDRNGDGHIDFTELMSMMRGMSMNADAVP